MAKRKQLHASSVILSLGLLTVMTFAIVLGISQIRKQQITSSSASSLKWWRDGPCDVFVDNPHDGDNRGIYGFAYTQGCDKNIKSATMRTWISANKVVKSETTGQITNSTNVFDKCPGGRLNTICQYAKWIGTTVYGVMWGNKYFKLSGTYKYCTWAKVAWVKSDNTVGSSGYIRSTDCKTKTY